MKKLLSSAFSLITSLAILGAAIPLSAAAEELTTEYGVIEDIDEKLIFGDSAGFSLGAPDTAQILGNYNTESGAYNLGYYLDENNAAVYMAFMKLINPSLDTITVTLPEPVSFQGDSRNVDMNSEEVYNAVFGACKSGIDCASFDLPELFWLDISQVSVGVEGLQYSYSTRTKKYTFTIKELTFDPAYYSSFSSLDEVMEYKEKLEAAVEDFEVTGSTRYEQLKSIHDTISLFTYYDTAGQFAGSALSALVVPGAVCEGYSKGFKLICDRLGIPCVCIFGNYDEEKSTAHMWNYVKMEDGLWYAIDLTWDDYDGANGTEIVYSYFLKGSDSFFRLHTENETYSLSQFTYPELSVNDYDPNAPVTTTASSVTSTTSTVSYSTTAVTTTVTEEAVSTDTTTTKRSSKTTAATAEVTALSTTAASTVSSVQTTETTAAEEKTTSATSAIGYERGDLNRDGAVGVADLVYCANHVLGRKTAEYDCDLTGDGITDVFDVVAMRQILSSMIYTID